MLKSLKVVCLLSVVAILAAALPAAAAPASASATGRLPLAFEKNEGQVDPSVRFMSRGKGYSLFLTSTEAALRLNGAKKESATVRWQVVGGNRNARIAGESLLPGKTNYFIGNDPKKWHSGIANYANVRYAGVYPGVDLVYHGDQRQVEYDFVVAPNANPKRIRLAFQGVDAMRIGAAGELILHTAHGDLVQPRPVVYQERDGRRQTVDGRYTLSAKNEVGFTLGRYDRSRELVIDPVLVYSTYFGGSDVDTGIVTVDASGNMYLSGLMVSSSFPGLSGSSIQPTSGGDYDAFVTKINAAGTAVVYSTYLGGDGGNEYGQGIAVDGSGNAYITGGTNSSNFPGAGGSSIQSSFGGGWRDAFLTKINAAGTAIVYSTYLGGSGDELGMHVAVDGSGNAYVSGFTGSTTFPGVTGSSIQPSSGGGGDAFVIKVNAAGTAATYATFLGGSADDNATGITVDGSGNAYVVGGTSSTSFPGVSGGSLQPSYGGGTSDAFVLKINAAGSAITWATYLGDSDYDYGAGIALDSSGNVVVSGGTASTSFPGVSGGSLQPANAGVQDAFITKINSGATAIVWSTFLGGDDVDVLSFGALALDSSDDVFIAGSTLSTTFNGVTGSSMQPSNGGGVDGYMAKVNAAGTAIVYSTFLGGSGDDTLYAFAVDSAGDFYASGYTTSTSFPGVTGSSLQSAYGGGDTDAYVVKISEQSPSLTSISPTSGYPGTQVTINGTNFGTTQGSGSVWLGSKLAGSIVSWSNTQIVAVVDAGATSGNAIVQQNGVWSNSIAFTVIAPNITSISPTSGYPGTQVTFTGTNFGASQGSGSVWLGSKAAGSIVSWSATQVVAVVASGAASGNAQIQQNGVWSNAIAFTVITPNVTSISPTSGVAGTQVTFTGTNFGASQGSGSVWLGSKLAGSIVSWSNTQIVATVASGSVTGSAQVQQNGVWSNSLTFTVTSPNLTSISPTTARAGDQITLTGTNFGASQGSGSVWLGSKLAGSIVSWSSTQVVATVASGSITGSAQVQQSGIWSNAISLTVITPVVSSLSPTSGPVGTQVTITGTGFGSSQGTGLVWIGTKYATVVSWSDTSVVATVAAASATGGTQVYQGGVWSNAVTFTVTP
jgi:IPT/TIG domain-containing protein/beta-propeller repeat-containing protein